MSEDIFRQPGRGRASPLTIALARWQHAAGGYWPYVCAAPFVSGIAASESPTAVAQQQTPSSRSVPLGESGSEGVVSRREKRPPPELREAVDAVASSEPTAIFVDLRSTSVLPATAWLNQRGFVVVPVIQRWVTSPAVLNCRLLVDQLIRFGAVCRRPSSIRGVVFVLDGDRRGHRESPRPVIAFDNRHSYTLSRFPPPNDLHARGIRLIRWVSAFGVAPDLEPYVGKLVRAGLRVVGRGVGSGDRDVSGKTTDGSEPGTTLTPTLSQRGETVYRRFVRRAQTHALLVDHLVEGEPYPALDALVLPAEDDALLRRITRVFAGAFDRAARILARDVPVLEEMGFPWVAAELLRDEKPRIPLIGRFDFVCDDSGHWWLLEFNADTPSGVREATGVEEALLDTIPTWRRFVRPNAGLGDTLTSAFVEATQGLPSGRALGLLTNATELEDLAQMAFTQRLLTGPLARLGVPVVLGDIDNLRRSRSGLVLCGREIGALYRYLAFESMFGTPPFVAIGEAAESGRLRLLNGLFGLLLQHKGMMSWLWANRTDPLLSWEERSAIAEHLPPTWNLAEWNESTASDVEPEGAVVKQVFGREGDEVFFGEKIAPERWALLRRRRTYVVQKRVRVRRFNVLVPTSSGNQRLSGYVTVGAFAVRGEWAGYYSRFGGEITNARAKWLATLVRGLY